MVAKPSVRSFQPQLAIDPSASALCPGQATGGKMVDQRGRNSKRSLDPGAVLDWLTRLDSARKRASRRPGGATTPRIPLAGDSRAKTGLAR